MSPRPPCDHTRSRRSDDGFTLVELLVTMMLMGVLGSLLLSTFTTSVNATRTIERRGQDTQTVRVAMDSMTRLVRTTVDPDGVGFGVPAVEVASPTELVFYANYEARKAQGVFNAQRVRYLLNGSGVLTETRTPMVRASNGTVSWPAAGARTRVLARDVVDPAGRSRFSFGVVRGAAGVVTVSDTALQTGDLENVRTVEVTLAVRSGTGTAVEALQSMTLPNAR